MLLQPFKTRQIYLDEVPESFHGMVCTIYVLELEKDHFYIGKTTKNIEERINEHLSPDMFRSVEWVRKYKPIRILQILHNCDSLDEDKYTKKYMSYYGIDRVRGGTYTQLILPDQKRLCLEDELRSASGSCFRCGKNDGHFAKECKGFFEESDAVPDSSEDDFIYISSGEENSD
jgi:GIY-YIG catalytic domain